MKFEVFNFIDEFCKENHIPHIGQEKGKILFDITENKHFGRILELGCASGYSTCILAHNLSKVITCDFDHVSVTNTKDHARRLKFDVEVMLSDAVEFTRKLYLTKTKFDLIFLDFSKADYIKVKDLCLYMLRNEGLMLVDNINNPKCSDFLNSVTTDKNLECKYLYKEEMLEIKKKL